jgi:hypothetical protein
VRGVTRGFGASVCAVLTLKREVDRVPLAQSHARTHAHPPGCSRPRPPCRGTSRRRRPRRSCAPTPAPTRGPQAAPRRRRCLPLFRLRHCRRRPRRAAQSGASAASTRARPLLLPGRWRLRGWVSLSGCSGGERETHSSSSRSIVSSSIDSHSTQGTAHSTQHAHAPTSPSDTSANAAVASSHQRTRDALRRQARDHLACCKQRRPPHVCVVVRVHLRGSRCPTQRAPRIRHSPRDPPCSRTTDPGSYLEVRAPCKRRMIREEGSVSGRTTDLRAASALGNF